MTVEDIKVSFIIPVLNLIRPLNKSRFFSRRYTIAETLRDIELKVNISNEVIVVCNGQQKDLVDWVVSHPYVNKYCLNSVNVGVSRSWNMGAELAEGQVLCFVNDDVEIGEGAVESLYKVMVSSNDIGQIGPMGAKWDGSDHLEYVGRDKIEEADAVSGFLFMLHSKVFREVGGFDPAYTPAGYEEIDMSFSLRRLGYKCIVVPGLNIKHHGHHGVSSYRNTISYLGKEIDSQVLHKRNKEYFEQKWCN